MVYARLQFLNKCASIGPTQSLQCFLELPGYRTLIIELTRRYHVEFTRDGGVQQSSANVPELNVPVKRQ